MTDKPKTPEPIETVLSARPDPVAELPEPAAADQTPQQLRPVLTEKEIAEVKAEARKRLEAERKKAAKQSLLEKELERLKQEEGMVVGGVADHMVQIHIDLPEMAPYISVNWHPYWHGGTYTVPRHVADSLREQIWRAWDHERQRKGESMTDGYRQARRTRISAVTGVAVNAPRTADAG